MYASLLDLNVGCYHIELSPGYQKIYTIVLPWGKYKHQKLSMGVCNSTNIFQENISELFKGFDLVREYIDGVLLITKNDFNGHLNVLEKSLQRFTEEVFRLNTEKLFFGRIETKYIGLWVSSNGARPL